MLIERIKQLQEKLEIEEIKNSHELEAFRLKYISKKGALNELFDEFKSASVEDKKTLGKRLNELKQLAEAKFKELSEKLNSSSKTSSNKIDLSLPIVSDKTGNLHPLNLLATKSSRFLSALGFQWPMDQK